MRLEALEKMGMQLRYTQIIGSLVGSKISFSGTKPNDDRLW